MRLALTQLRSAIRFFSPMVNDDSRIADLLDEKALSKQKIALKPLRKAQRCLGQLNDDVNGRRLARSLRSAGIAVPLQLPDARREKRLLQKAEAAYRKLARLKLAAK